MKDFFKCAAVVLAILAFGLALSAIVHCPRTEKAGGENPAAINHNIIYRGEY